MWVNIYIIMGAELKNKKNLFLFVLVKQFERIGILIF